MKISAASVLEKSVSAIGGTPRSGQVQMVADISATLDEAEHLLIQAGTGTGKSFGYLIPIITKILDSDQSAVVSTATLALQRQILNQDIPTIAQVLKAEKVTVPRVALLKGWANYLCLNKLAGGYPSEEGLFEVETELSLQPDDSSLGAQVLRLRQWAEESETGDRDDLVPGVTDRIWSMFSLSRRDCLGGSCPLLKDCFAWKSRNAVAAAQLVITNHSMLGVAVTSENDILPEGGIIVVDEAHELVSRVRSQSTVSISAAILQRLAGQISRYQDIDISSLEKAAKLLEDALANMSESVIWNTATPELTGALNNASTVTRQVFAEVGASPSEAVGEDAVKHHLVRQRIVETLELLDLVTMISDNTVRWVSRDLEGRSQLNAAQLDLSADISQRLWQDRSVIATSATLSLGGSFEHMATQLGLSLTEKAWRGIDVGSPFNYAKQGILYVAKHLKPPGAQWPSEEALAELVDLVACSQGGVLFLSSSRRGANQAAEILRDRLDFPVMCQGDDQLPTLLKRFKADPDSCLIGTLSLWQGVDIPGPACRLVVIDRIPFPHREDPVVQALQRNISRQGGNGFSEVSLTRAALLLAQGSGRLLRSTEDRGMVAILDSRLATAGYGEFLRRSLPEMWLTGEAKIARDALVRLAKSLEETPE